MTSFRKTDENQNTDTDKAGFSINGSLVAAGECRAPSFVSKNANYQQFLTNIRDKSVLFLGTLESQGCTPESFILDMKHFPTAAYGDRNRRTFVKFHDKAVSLEKLVLDIDENTKGYRSVQIYLNNPIRDAGVSAALQRVSKTILIIDPPTIKNDPLTDKRH